MNADKKALRYVYSAIKLAGNKGLLTTAVHKIVFLSMLEADEDPAKLFIPYFYGPFSEAVAYALDALVFAGYVEAEEQGFGRRFRPKNVSKTLPEESAVGAVFERLKKARVDDENIKLLADITKVLWIIKKYGVKEPPKIAQEARWLGWRLTEPRVKEVIALIQEMSYGSKLGI